VPYESVYSVIEVKSRIAAADLSSTSGKFSAIRKLPRCSLIGKPKRSKTRNPIFVLFGYELATTEEQCVDFVRRDGTDDVVLFALNAGLAMLWDELPNGLKHQHVFLRTADRTGDFHETLVWFFFVLLESLSQIELGTPKYSELLYDGKYEEDR
jgi:hypothetical protein